MDTFLPVLAFMFGTCIIAAVGYTLLGRRSVAIDRRLREVTGGSVPQDAEYGTQIATFFGRMGERLPKSARELSKLGLRLVQAGYRRQDALAIFVGIRFSVAFCAFGVLATPVIIRPNVALALIGLAFGYLIPGMVLARLVKRRQHRISLALPDALDLLVVSVEAGLGLDQAMARIAQELGRSHADLAGELRLVNLELLAGKARPEALRNLAERTGVEDLNLLVAMLVQTDRFGTSIANSLRVFSEGLRTRRRQRAEEVAAKTGVKMVFPLVLCIFPAIWIVAIGPAAIKFVRVLGPLAAGLN